MTQRAIARKLGVSEATIRKHLRALRQAGRVDDGARARALAAQGGHRRGGRPMSALDDDTLTAAWAQHLQAASERGRPPSIATLATHLHAGRHRVRARLQELGLLEQENLVPEISPRRKQGTEL